MTVKEQLIERIKAMPEDEAERWLERMTPQDESSPSEGTSSLEAFFDMMDEIAANAPQEELDRLPTDLSYNADHYLYGTPKRP
ncbi:MAG: hypothetical protein KY468_08360 [Armatimonadetes bacterium]|nr:hypothetical protein [Armatimonadota bacterium]